VRGYFAWTLVDNFEWQEGWNANFGLTHLDKKSKTLRMEASGRWFQEFIKTHPEP
jgi:beta-glucosidase